MAVYHLGVSKSKNINIRVDPEEKARIDADARTLNLSTASFLLMLYAQWRKEEERKNPTSPAHNSRPTTP